MEADFVPQITEFRDNCVLKISTDVSKTQTDTEDEELLLSQRNTVSNRTMDNHEMDYITSYSETEPLMYSSNSYFTTFSCTTFLTAQPEVR